MAADAQPLYATQRNPHRETCGGKVAKILELYGHKTMPWQRETLDVACELDPATGSFWYQTVVIVDLRRAGKTTVSRAKLMHRGLADPGCYMTYTAQDRIKALGRLRKDLYTPTLKTPIGGALGKPRWVNGSEALRFVNGSELGIDAVSRRSGHGDTLHEWHADEAYALRDSTLEAGLQPPLLTVPGSQQWVLSAAGDADSAYLKGKVDLGRALVQAGTSSRICYREYSAPEDADPNDPQTLDRAHPAVGLTLELDRIMALRVGAGTPDDLSAWERAWLGWWPRTQTRERIIPVAGWQTNYVPEATAAWTGTPIWSVDVSPEREYATIALAAASPDPDRRCYLEVYERQLGTAGVVGALKTLKALHGGAQVALAGSGAAHSLKSDLEDAGFDVVALNGPRVIDACGGFYDDALVGKLAWVADPVLDEAMEAAAKHSMGGKTFIWARGAGDITPLYAVTIARAAWLTNREPDYDTSDSLG